MLACFTDLRELNFLGICLRITLAVLCGGFIGFEREHKRRPAGFRTHILICLGAAMATATGQYLYVSMHYPTDMARMGAQVIAGVGFIGTGAIILTKRRQVRGLTTAAGLWVAAIVGLCCGAGFYEGAVSATILVLVAEVVFSKLEYRLLRNMREINVYIEYLRPSCLEEIMHRCHMFEVKVVDIEITKKEMGSASACAILTLQLRKGVDHICVLEQITETKGIVLAELV